MTAWMRGDALRDYIGCNPREARLAGLHWLEASGASHFGRMKPQPGVDAAGPAPSEASAALRDLVDDAGRPLDATREYLVVTNNFLAHGGDGFEGFLAARGLAWTESRVRDVVRSALGVSRDIGEAGGKKKSGDFKGG